MSDFGKKILSGAASGLVSALLIDIHAWSRAGGTFSWGLALQRWIAGAVSGAMAGAGVGSAAA